MHEDRVLEKELAREIDERAERVRPARRDRVERSITGGRRRQAVRRLGSGLAAAAAIALVVTGAALIVEGDERATAPDNIAAGGDASGRIAYAKTVDGRIDLYVYDLETGSETRLTSAAGNQTTPDWSPDGTKIVFQGYRESSGANDGIFTIEVATGSITELNPSVSGMEPVWSPDGTKIAFVNAADGAIWAMGSDGASPTQLSDGPSDASPQWAPDGSKIAFIRSGSLYLMAANGTGQTALTSASQEAYPAWSPDGTKVAFTRQVDGNSDIFVVSADGSGLSRLTTAAEHDSQPAWSPGGSELLYASVVDGEATVFAMNPDGTGKRQVATVTGSVSGPDWAPAS